MLSSNAITLNAPKTLRLNSLHLDTIRWRSSQTMQRHHWLKTMMVAGRGLWRTLTNLLFRSIYLETDAQFYVNCFVVPTEGDILVRLPVSCSSCTVQINVVLSFRDVLLSHRVIWKRLTHIHTNDYVGESAAAPFNFLRKLFLCVQMWLAGKTLQCYVIYEL